MFSIFMKFKISLFSLLILVVSCQNSSSPEEQETSNLVSSTVFGNKQYQFPPLSQPAKVQAVHWGVLEDILTEAKRINGGDFQTVQNSSERIVEYSDSLFKKIPDTLNTNPIRSRLMVMKTRAELLYQTAHKGILDSAELQNSVSEMNIAVTNLIVHLNEKFAKDLIDAQRVDNERTELRARNRYRDSIFELERKDLQKK